MLLQIHNADSRRGLTDWSLFKISESCTVCSMVYRLLLIVLLGSLGESPSVPVSDWPVGEGEVAGSSSRTASISFLVDALVICRASLEENSRFVVSISETWIWCTWLF
jgi:hypothetical protein